MILKIKKIVLKTFQKYGYELTRRQATNGVDSNVLYYIAGLLYGKGNGGSLIQIGANDGVTNDPVKRIIGDFKIPSILVEPQPLIFDRLKLLYHTSAHVKLINVAIDKENGARTLYYIDPSAKNYPAWASGIASFDKATLLKHRSALPFLENYIKEFNVPTYSYDKLLKEHDVQTVFLLQVDVEGYDYELLKHIISLGRYPGIIHYEHKHLSYSDQWMCRKMLIDVGYTFVNGKSDTIAIFKDISL